MWLIDWFQLPKVRIEQLANAGFMDQAYNLIIVGGTGTGKTHLAAALGVASIHHGKRIRFYNAIDLVNQLNKEKQQGKAGNRAKQLTAMELFEHLKRDGVCNRVTHGLSVLRTSNVIFIPLKIALGREHTRYYFLMHKPETPVLAGAAQLVYSGASDRVKR